MSFSQLFTFLAARRALTCLDADEDQAERLVMVTIKHSADELVA
jgi:hypothetical protein